MITFFFPLKRVGAEWLWAVGWWLLELLLSCSLCRLAQQHRANAIPEPYVTFSTRAALARSKDNKHTCTLHNVHQHHGLRTCHDIGPPPLLRRLSLTLVWMWRNNRFQHKMAATHKGTRKTPHPANSPGGRSATPRSSAVCHCRPCRWPLILAFWTATCAINQRAIQRARAHGHSRARMSCGHSCHEPGVQEYRRAAVCAAITGM